MTPIITFAFNSPMSGKQHVMEKNVHMYYSVQVIVDTQAFMTAAMMSPLDNCPASNNVVEMFPCLRHLPAIFHLAMRALAQVVDMWLGITPSQQFSSTSSLAHSNVTTLINSTNVTNASSHDGPSSPTNVVQSSRRSGG